MQTEIYTPIIFCGWLFAWENLFACLPWAYHILTLFRMITYFKHHALLSQNFVYDPYLWLKIYRWSCTWLVLLLTWSLLPWGFCADVDVSYQYCCEECTLMHNLIISLKIRYSPFHCSRLRIPFCLAEFPNIWTPCWFLGSVSVGEQL